MPQLKKPELFSMPCWLLQEAQLSERRHPRQFQHRRKIARGRRGCSMFLSLQELAPRFLRVLDYEHTLTYPNALGWLHIEAVMVGLGRISTIT